MGKKMITIPFDLELAKKINNGERNGMVAVSTMRPPPFGLGVR